MEKCRRSAKLLFLPGLTPARHNCYPLDELQLPCLLAVLAEAEIHAAICGVA
jgi:hypothetical protein